MFIQNLDSRSHKSCVIHNSTRSTSDTDILNAVIFVIFKDLNHTGYFRDQKRRVDMIIVVDDTNNIDIERIKDAFFTNCINAGLEFELEMGVVSLSF